MATSNCEHCGELLEFTWDQQGKTTPCPKCGETTRLTGAGVPTIKIPQYYRPQLFDRATEHSPVKQLADQLTENIEQVVVGKREKIRLVLTALLAEGHLLLEDVPGVAKTVLARCLAQSLGGVFKRVQCTPDLLPSDITGSSIFSPKTTEFTFRPGPVFAHVLLADEINRATPRAQSALLQAMAEAQVSVDGTVHELDPPFFLIATQNPIDHEGTFPLPEAQLDRFLFKISLGYPSFADESTMIETLSHSNPLAVLTPVASIGQVLECQRLVRAVKVDVKIREYLLQIVRMTREHDSVALGASPRAALAFYKSCQAHAAINGYPFVLPDDVKFLAPHVLAHRLLLKPESRLRKQTAVGVIQEILDQTDIPVLHQAVS